MLPVSAATLAPAIADVLVFMSVWVVSSFRMGSILYFAAFLPLGTSIAWH